MNDRMLNKIEGIGIFYVDKRTDDSDYAYPGVDVEFVPEHENEETLSRPRVVFEYSKKEHELRVLIWNNPNSEDYSGEITFDLEKYIER